MNIFKQLQSDLAWTSLLDCIFQFSSCSLYIWEDNSDFPNGNKKHWILHCTESGPNTNYGTESYVGRTVLQLENRHHMFYYRGVPGADKLYYTYYPTDIKCIVDRTPKGPSIVPSDIQGYRGDVSRPKCISLFTAPLTPTPYSGFFCFCSHQVFLPPYLGG